MASSSSSLLEGGGLDGLVGRGVAAARRLVLEHVVGEAVVLAQRRLWLQLLQQLLVCHQHGGHVAFGPPNFLVLTAQAANDHDRCVCYRPWWSAGGRGRWWSAGVLSTESAPLLLLQLVLLVAEAQLGHNAVVLLL